MVVYSAEYNKKELKYYQTQCEKNGIDFIAAKDDVALMNYVNWKDTKGKVNHRSGSGADNDLVTDIAYSGHGNKDGLWIGYPNNQEMDITAYDFCPDAFAGTGEANLLGCNNGNAGGIAETMVDLKLVKSATGYEGTTWWGADKDEKYGVGKVRDQDPPKADMIQYGDPSSSTTTPNTSTPSSNPE